MLSMSIGTIDGKQLLNVFRRADLEAGKVEPFARSDFGQAILEGFVFTRDGRYLYGSSYYTGVSNIFRFDPATGEREAVSNAETGFFRPIPMADGYADRPGIHGGRLRADDHRAEAAGGCQRHHLSRGTAREQAPDRQAVGRWPARGRGPRVDDHAPRQVPADARARLWRRLSHRRGVQGFRRARLSRSPTPTPPSCTGSIFPRVTRWTTSCRRKRSRTSTCATRRPCGAGSTGTTGRISTTCSAPPSEAAREMRSWASTRKRSFSTIRAGSTCRSWALISPGSTRCPLNQNVPTDFSDIVSGEAKLEYTDTRSSQGFRGS